MNDKNSNWLFSIPPGWDKLCRAMIEECEAINPSYQIEDLKEKWGCLCVSSYIRDYEDNEWLLPASNDKEIEKIENKYIAQSARTCCICGAPVTNFSTGWLCPYCDECYKDRFKL